MSNQNIQNPAPGKQVAPAMKRMPIEIYIGYDPTTQQMTVNGPFENWPLFFELLDMTKEQIKQVHVEEIKKRSRAAIQLAPASALNDIERMAKANGG